MSTTARINSAAAEYNQIIARLKDTDYAPPALAEQNRYLQDLHNEIALTEREVGQLKTKLAKEQQEHERYQNSTFKRFAYKVGGKKADFNDKAAKEEREYFEALQANFEAKRRLESINSQLAEATNVKLSLEGASEENADAHASMDRLFSSIFAGETPEFPEEDAREHAVNDATTKFAEKQAALQTEQRVAKILEDAVRIYNAAMMDIDSALRSSQMDMMGFGGSFADMAERSSLARAQNSVSQAVLTVEQARRLQPQVAPAGQVRIAQGNIMSDILFDNIFTDYNFHKKIEQSGNEVIRAREKIKLELRKAYERKATAEEEISVARAVLDTSRAELQRVRQETFARVIEGRSHAVALPDEDEPPPRYESLS